MFVLRGFDFGRRLFWLDGWLACLMITAFWPRLLVSMYYCLPVGIKEVGLDRVCSLGYLWACLKGW